MEYLEADFREFSKLVAGGLTCAGVNIPPERLLHTPVDSLAQAAAQDAGKPDAEGMQVRTCPAGCPLDGTCLVVLCCRSPCHARPLSFSVCMMTCR